MRIINPLASAYFRSATGWLGGKVVVFSLLGLLNQSLLTRNLTRTDYGLLVWLGTIIGLLAPVGLPGVSTAITGAVAKGFDGNFRKGSVQEILGGAVGGIILLGFAWYQWAVVGSHSGAFVFVAAAVVGPGIWLDTHTSFWNGKKDFRSIFWWSVMVRTIQVAATYGVFFISTNIVLVAVIQVGLQALANLFAVGTLLRSPHVGHQHSQEYAQYGVVSSWLYLVGTLSSQLDKLIIGIFFGLEPLALFTVGELLYQYIYKIPGSMLQQILSPRLAAMSVRDAVVWMRKRQWMIVVVVVAACGVTALALPSVYPLVFSAKYNDSITFAYLFLGCIVLGTPSMAVGSVFKAHAMKKETGISWAILALTPLAVVPLFGWWWGLIGIVAARGVTNAIAGVYYTLALSQIAKGNPA